MTWHQATISVDNDVKTKMKWRLKTWGDEEDEDDEDEDDEEDDDEDSTATVLQQRDPLTLKCVERGSEGKAATTKMKTALVVLQQHDPLPLEYVERGSEGGVDNDEWRVDGHHLPHPQEDQDA